MTELSDLNSLISALTTKANGGLDTGIHNNDLHLLCNGFKRLQRRIAELEKELATRAQPDLLSKQVIEFVDFCIEKQGISKPMMESAFRHFVKSLSVTQEQKQ